MGQVITHIHIQTLIDHRFFLVRVVHGAKISAQDPVDLPLPTNFRDFLCYYFTMSRPPAHSTRSSTSTTSTSSGIVGGHPPLVTRLFSADEIHRAQNDISQLRDLFFSRQLLLPIERTCLRCDSHLLVYENPNYKLHLRFHCTSCDTDECVTRGSIFEHFDIDMVKLGELICQFDCRLTVSQASRQSGVCRETVGKLWKLIRERMSSYIDSHPILFKPGDIVEVDEIFLKPLLERNQENPDESVWHPIIGCIDRKSGRVALEICQTHSTRDIRQPILSHFPSRVTTVVTDRHRSFAFLGRYVHHVWCTKRHRGSAVYPVTRWEQTPHGESFKVHTNTIEGFWSDLRLHIHASHGWTAEYLPLFLREAEFRSLRLPLTTVIRV